MNLDQRMPNQLVAANCANRRVFFQVMPAVVPALIDGESTLWHTCTWGRFTRQRVVARFQALSRRLYAAY